ncbi:MAG: DUF202 domain-containing protein [Candidatus Cloacimonetes bacterium]|nr:DUF202 domain-containing protein [Candidatus Cloacimonadota bacterium]MCF8262695.1 DUF202 domain-containing protein [Melioribacteraceae bacterium]
MRDHLAFDRTMLANERTLLSYTRTFVMFTASGFTLIKLLPDLFFNFLGVALMGLALIVMLIGLKQFFKTRVRLLKIYKTGENSIT